MGPSCCGTTTQTPVSAPPVLAQLEIGYVALLHWISEISLLLFRQAIQDSKLVSEVYVYLEQCSYRACSFSESLRSSLSLIGVGISGEPKFTIEVGVSCWHVQEI